MSRLIECHQCHNLTSSRFANPQVFVLLSIVIISYSHYAVSQENVSGDDDIVEWFINEREADKQEMGDAI